MNYADIKKVDIANGEGVRVSVFVSGCNHHCKGCFNKCAWDFNYGNKFTEKEEEKIIDYMNHDYIEGLTLLGGEPFIHKNIAEIVSYLGDRNGEKIVIEGTELLAVALCHETDHLEGILYTDKAIPDTETVWEDEE